MAQGEAGWVMVYVAFMYPEFVKQILFTAIIQKGCEQFTSSTLW